MHETDIATGEWHTGDSALAALTQVPSETVLAKGTVRKEVGDLLEISKQMLEPLRDVMTGESQRQLRNSVRELS